MTTLIRFLVVQSLLLWQGGFVFYAAVVVPTGTDVLGAEGQGAITARVTDWLNVIGIVCIAVLALGQSLTRDPNTRRTRRWWWVWGIAFVCQLVLLYVHTRLEAFMDEERKHILDHAAFYPIHGVYLWTSTVQWLACLLLTWWTLQAWKAEDENSINHREGPRAAGDPLCG
jgi:hypothetical protein